MSKLKKFEKKLNLDKSQIMLGISFTLFQVLIGVAFIIIHVWLLTVFYLYNVRI